MTPRGSRRKGTKWERDVAKLLSRWLTDGESSDLLNRNTKGGSGDLRASHPIAWEFLQKFSVECKCWKSAEFADWLLTRAPSSKVSKAVAQAKRDAAGKNFFLIVKQNRRAPFVLTETSWLHTPGSHLLFECYRMFPLSDLLETKAHIFLEGEP